MESSKVQAIHRVKVILMIHNHRCIKYLDIKYSVGRMSAMTIVEDTSGAHLWLVLWKATSALEDHALQSIENLAICQSDFAVLEFLHRKGLQPVNIIGRKILLTSGSITTAIDRLEKRSFVERKWEHEDRRVCLVDLTATGKKFIQAAFRDHASAMEKAAGGLSPEERGILLKLLKKLGHNARALLSEAPEVIRKRKIASPTGKLAAETTEFKESTDRTETMHRAPEEENSIGFAGFTGLD
jgi:MarR family transcriptional regulator, 2-MHQ and catechol-resistance regulon repressor